MLNNKCSFVIERHSGHGPHVFASDLIGEVKRKHNKGGYLMTQHETNMCIPALPSSRRQTQGCCGRYRGLSKDQGRCFRVAETWLAHQCPGSKLGGPVDLESVQVWSHTHQIYVLSVF